MQVRTTPSPLSRMRLWKVASEYITLDQLSAGRAILVVGLGAATTLIHVTNFCKFDQAAFDPEFKPLP
jgi:hypothetical protein